VTELTKAQITKIYKGEITNWKELGGPNLAIVVISRDTSSGTYESFHELVINKEKMAASVEYVSSNPQAMPESKRRRAQSAMWGWDLSMPLSRRSSWMA